MHPGLIFDRSFINRIFDLFTRKQDVGEISGDQPNVAHLAYIAAHPDYQGRRIGSILLNESKRIAAERGKLYHRAGVYKKNTASQRMFEKCGHVKLVDLEMKYVVFMQAELNE